LLSELGLNLAAIISIVISSLFFLSSYLKIPHVFRLFRGLLTYIVIILITIYCFSNIYIELGIIFNENPSKEFKDTIYFSTVTWTTLGYGDFRPSEEARIWAATESMLGYIYMGILVGLLITGLTPKESRFSGKKPEKNIVKNKNLTNAFIRKTYATLWFHADAGRYEYKK